MRHGQQFNYDSYVQSLNKLTEMGVFRMVDVKFTPRDTTERCDTLDLMIDCIFDKPYDFYVETNMTGKTTGRVGPGIVVGVTKRNAFRGGEKLDINLKGSYEWQTGHRADGSSSKFNSYEYGADVSVEFPRVLAPFWQHRRWHVTPTTLLKASSNVLNRSSYFKRHVVSGELTYTFQPTATRRHQFSPLVLQYEYMKDQSQEFKDILQANPYLLYTMQDRFVPQMRYSFTYMSPSSYRNPIYWQTTVSEASNILSLGYMVAGKKWDAKDKKMFKNPFAQYVKLETDFRKTWQVGDHSQLVAHFNGGVIWAYGNSTYAPYSEPRLFGNLYGAVFLDAGNIWALKDDGVRENSQFKIKNVLKQTALGTGIGIRYDLDFFVLRLDWGIGLHVPYKNGLYNMSGFGNSQSIHFAIGYPF